MLKIRFRYRYLVTEPRFLNWEVGALERIRTSDLCLRRAALYPAELRVHWFLAALKRSWGRVIPDIGPFVYMSCACLMTIMTVAISYDKVVDL